MTDLAPHLERAFSLEVPERSYVVGRIDGQLPGWVRGSYYLNGPARFSRGELNYRHWLDGDGMVCALHFDDGEVRFVNRFVRSEKFRAEEQAGRALFRTFGTAFESDQLRRGIALQSPVNVSTFLFNGRLLAAGEQGLPWELDPQTLETLGEYTFGGQLNEISPMSAHVRIDQATGEMFNFGVSFTSRRPNVQLYRFSRDGDLVYRRRVPVDHAYSMHDFNLSREHVVFYLAPYLLDMRALMERGVSIMDALSWEPERGSQLLILSRETGKPLATLPVGSRYCLHHINAFEQGQRLIVDLVELDRPVYDQYQVIPDLFQDVPLGRPVRFIIDTDSWEIVERREIDCPVAPDFPSVDPRRAQGSYEDLWMLGISKTGEPGRKFFDQLLHLSWERPRAQDVWQVPPGRYLGGEPVFIPDPAEGSRGLVICQLFDAAGQTGAFYLFDAHDVGAGPVCTLWLEHPIPPLFHAWFEPAGRV